MRSRDASDEEASQLELEETIPDKAALRAWYEGNREGFDRLLAAMVDDLRACLADEGLMPTIKARVKSFDSLFAKVVRTYVANRAAKKTASLKITDCVGLRIICPFIEDLAASERAIGTRYKVVEHEKKGSERTFREFGYESIHLLVALPGRFSSVAAEIPHGVVEVQIRTILQDAWAEVEHELVYKNEFNPLDEQMKRKLAALNASLSLSDVIFQELRNYQRDLARELESRRESFHSTIQDAIDSPFIEDGPDRKEAMDDSLPGMKEAPQSEAAKRDDLEFKSIDDLLVKALSAHNSKDYERAVEIYGRILSLRPKKEIVAVIRKHRGMAYFSRGMYAEAMDDFGATLAIDPGCHKVAYYRGVVNSVLEKYPEALADYDLALSINPCHFYSLYRRAQTYYHLGDFPKALADAETASGIEPENEAVERLKTLVRRRLAM